MSEQKRKLTNNVIKAHIVIGKNEKPAVCLCTQKMCDDGVFDSGYWVDLTTFFSYDELINFAKLLFDSDEIVFLNYRNIPLNYVDLNYLEFDKIIEFSEVDKAYKNPYEAYVYWKDDEASIEDFSKRYRGFFDTPEMFVKTIYENDGLISQLPDWAKDHIDWRSIWASVKDTKYIVLDGYYYFEM